jgi:hypothetical protein
MGSSAPAVEDEGEGDKEEELVELGGVAGDAVAEVDGPGEGGGDAVGVVGEAGDEAAEAADGDADAEGDGEEVAGAGADAGEELDELDGEPAAEQAADDGLAAGLQQLGPVQAEFRGLFEETEEARADEGADGRGGDDGPAAVVGEGVAALGALMAVDGKAGRVAEGLKEGVERGMEEGRQVRASVSGSTAASSGLDRFGNGRDGIA